MTTRPCTCCSASGRVPPLRHHLPPIPAQQAGGCIPPLEDIRASERPGGRALLSQFSHPEGHRRGQRGGAGPSARHEPGGRPRGLCPFPSAGRVGLIDQGPAVEEENLRAPCQGRHLQYNENWIGLTKGSNHGHSIDRAGPGRHAAHPNLTISPQTEQTLRRAMDQGCRW